MARFSQGQDIRYKPVGGPESQTPESTGTIMKVSHEQQQAGEDPKYEVKNKNTGKTTVIYERNILGMA